MHASNYAGLLDALDRGARASTSERALLLLEVWLLDPVEKIERMPLGWVAARLLELRAALIGPSLECLGDCRECGAALECEAPVGQLVAAGPAAVVAGETFRLRHEEYEIEYRLPATADLIAVRGGGEAGRSLALRLIGRAWRSGELLEAEALPDEVWTALEGSVLERDPLAQVELSLACPACGRRSSEPLDVADFVWRELSVLGQGLVYEVARLAWAFGWREADILAMSDQRRRRYLELLPA
jgi:hypothetical protein